MKQGQVEEYAGFILRNKRSPVYTIKKFSEIVDIQQDIVGKHGGLNIKRFKGFNLNPKRVAEVYKVSRHDARTLLPIIQRFYDMLDYEHYLPQNDIDKINRIRCNSGNL